MQFFCSFSHFQMVSISGGTCHFTYHVRLWNLRSIISPNISVPLDVDYVACHGTLCLWGHLMVKFQVTPDVEIRRQSSVYTGKQKSPLMTSFANLSKWQNCKLFCLTRIRPDGLFQSQLYVCRLNGHPVYCLLFLQKHHIHFLPVYISRLFLR